MNQFHYETVEARTTGRESLADTLSTGCTANFRISPQMARGVQATENAWRDMEAEIGMYSGQEIAKLLGSYAKTGPGYAASQRERRRVIGIRRRNAIVHPGFQLRNGKIREAIPGIIGIARELDAPKSDLAQW